MPETPASTIPLINSRCSFMHYRLHLGIAHTSIALRSVCTIGHIFVFYLIFFEKVASRCYCNRPVAWFVQEGLARRKSTIFFLRDPDKSLPLHNDFYISCFSAVLRFVSLHLAAARAEVAFPISVIVSHSVLSLPNAYSVLSGNRTIFSGTP